MKDDDLKILITQAMTRPVVWFPARELRTYMESIFGAATAPAMYHACQWTAKKSFLINAPSLEDLNLQELLAIMKQQFETFGWGLIEFGNIDEDRKLGVFTVRECFECESSVTSVRDCYMMRGLASGILSAIFKVDIAVTETECRFRGDNACVCAFSAV